MIPLMFLLGQQLSGSGDGLGQVTPPGTVPSGCASGCTTPLPEIRNSSGDVVNIGDFWTEQGGYYAGLYTITGNEVYALIISEKNFGEIISYFATENTSSTDLHTIMNSLTDGLKNTNNGIQYMVNNNLSAKLPILSTIQNKRNGSFFKDWYMPSFYEYILLLQNFMPNSNCSKSGYSTCATIQRPDMIYAFPCGACSIPNAVETTLTKFKFNQSECLQPTLPNLTTPNDMILSMFLNSLSIVNFTFYAASGTVVNSTRANPDNLTGYGGVNFTRLIRRVLVS